MPEPYCSATQSQHMHKCISRQAPVKATRARAPGGSFICPYTRVHLDSLALSPSLITPYSQNTHNNHKYYTAVLMGSTSWQLLQLLLQSDKQLEESNRHSQILSSPCTSHCLHVFARQHQQTQRNHLQARETNHSFITCQSMLHNTKSSRVQDTKFGNSHREPWQHC